MSWKSLTHRARVRVIGASVLAAGLLAALVLFFVVPAEVEDPLGDPSESKRYLHDMELYGGKANVLQDEFRRWFDGLWRGKQLAGTVAVLSVVLAAGTQLFAGPRRPAMRLVAPGPRKPPGS